MGDDVASILNPHLIVPVEDVLSFTDSADRIFYTFFLLTHRTSAAATGYCLYRITHANIQCRWKSINRGEIKAYK